MAAQRPAIVWLRHLVGRGDLPAIGREVREAALHGLEFRLWLDHGSPAVRRKIEDWWPSVPDTAVHSGPARGPGAALLGPLLDPSSEIYLKNESKKVRLLLDWDAYDLRDPRVRQAALDVAVRLREGRALLGLGTRSRVVLDPDPALDRARQVTEMLHAGFIRGLGRDLRPANPCRVRLRAPGAYRRFGDPVPGFYAVDPAHPRFPLFHATVLRDMARADLGGYAGDPYFVMAAAVLAPVASVAVPVRPQPGPPGSYALRTIGAVHREIGRTSIGPAYRRWAEGDEAFASALARHYPRRAVEEVRRRALRGLGGRA